MIRRWPWRILDRIVDSAVVLKINGKSYQLTGPSKHEPAQEVKLNRSRHRAATVYSGYSCSRHSSAITSPKHPAVASTGNDAGGSIWPR